MSTAEIAVLTQYLTFKLGEEVFAVDVAQVQEVLEITEITRIPRTPGFIPGVINVRGSVVPIVDMRVKFGMPGAERTVDTCIIVTEVMPGSETIVLGALVDSVQEVVELEPEQIEPPPQIGIHLNTEFIKGMGKHDSHFIIMLDIDRAFSSEEITIVKETEKLISTGKGDSEKQLERID